IPYSVFEDYLEEGRIAEVQVSERFIQGTLKAPLEGGQTRFMTTRVEPELAEQLSREGVVVTGRIESTLLRDIISWIIPVVLFVGLWMYLIRRMGGGTG